MEPKGPAYYVFICNNKRPEGHPRGSCGPQGAQECVMRFADEIGKRNMWDKFMMASTSCLGPCGAGVTVVIYPEGTWYCGVKPDDVPEIIDAMNEGRRVERLEYSWAPESQTAGEPS